jgi:hypothetical protein
MQKYETLFYFKNIRKLEIGKGKGVYPATTSSKKKKKDWKEEKNEKKISTFFI